MKWNNIVFISLTEANTQISMSSAKPQSASFLSFINFMAPRRAIAVTERGAFIAPQMMTSGVYDIQRGHTNDDGTNTYTYKKVKHIRNKAHDGNMLIVK